jgi:hypothetical protein
VIDGRWTGAVCGRRALPSLVVVLLAASAFAQRPASGPALAPNRPLSADQVERYVDTLEELVALGERPVVDPTEARRKGPGLVYEGKVRARLEAHGFDARSFRRTFPPRTRRSSRRSADASIVSWAEAEPPGTVASYGSATTADSCFRKTVGSFVGSWHTRFSHT